MKKIIRILSVVALLAGTFAVNAATPPALINYQGRVWDDLGEPVNTSTTVQVHIYTEETGGSPVWQQALSPVVILNGLCDFEFGDAALVDVLTNEMCWIELTIGSETLSSRQLLVTVPYALRADIADSVDVAMTTVPSGLIALWTGDINEIPEGWLLCNGANGTPDLTDKFLFGASDVVPPGTTGGANSYALVTAQLPSHTHAGTSSTAGAHTHSASTSTDGAHTHSASVNSVSHAHNHKQRNYTDTYPKDSFATYGSGSTSSVGSSSSGNHGHSVSQVSAGAHTHSITINSGGAHTHSLSTGSAGEGAAIDNRPTTVLLAYIVKE